MKNLVVSALLSLSFVVAPTVQATCPLRCPTVKTVGLTATAAGFTFLTAAYVQYRQEQNDAAAAALVESSSKYFKPSFLNNEKIVSTTAAVKKFLKFATKIYVNAHRPSSYNATFEAYPKLTVLAWSCDAVVFAACVKAYAKHNKAKADAQEAEEKAATDKVVADKAAAEAANALAAQKVIEEAAAQKKLDEARALGEAEEATKAALLNQANKNHALELKGKQEESALELDRLNAALGQATNEDKPRLEAQKAAVKKELQKTAEELRQEIAKARNATAQAKIAFDTANDILNVNDPKNNSKKMGAAGYLAYRQEQSNKGRSDKKGSDKEKLDNAQKAYNEAKKAFDNAQTAYKACQAAEATLAPVVAKPAVVPVGKPVVMKK